MALKRKIEQISFKDENGNYLDVTVCDGYIEVAVDDNKEHRISLTLDDWKSIDKEVRRLFKDMNL
jgi:hypothetical protein